jgi:hypothetical protein
MLTKVCFHKFFNLRHMFSGMKFFCKPHLLQIVLLILLQSTNLHAQHQSKEGVFGEEYKKIVVGVHKILCEQHLRLDTSTVMSIKIKISNKDKVLATEYSQNFPISVQTKITGLLSGKVVWSKLNPVGEFDVIIPVYYLLKNQDSNSEMTSTDDLLKKSFTYPSGFLFNSVAYKSIILFEPILYIRSIGNPPIDRMTDSSDLKSQKIKSI